MSENEIKRGIDRLLEQLQAEVAKLRREAMKWEGLSDSYWQQIVHLSRERDRLQMKVTELQDKVAARSGFTSIRLGTCNNPTCQICQPGNR